ncbi:MAG: ABC transporter ATP-binding protein, partial [Candidatus Methanofastidiosia archaeon]
PQNLKIKKIFSLTNMSTENIIKIDNLTKRYGKILALDNLSLEIEEGDCVGFLGPNGAGKSTTIKILTSLISPTKGTAYINGHDIRKNKKEALESVGCVVETPDFYPYLTPIETLNYLGKLRGVDDLEGRNEDILKIVKLQDWANTRVGSFSKGMKQRLAIGQALLHDPDLLILDEPSSGLDPKGMAETRDLINSLKKEKTIFLSSHMLAEVQHISDRVALINKGKLLAYDSVNALSKKFFDVKEVIIETLKPLTEKELSRIKDIKSVKGINKTNEKTYAILFRGKTEEERICLLKSLVEENIKVASFNPRGLALESIYMEMIE